MGKRVLLFLGVNILVMLTLSILFGILNSMGFIPPGYSGLLVMCAIFGFGGAFISLAMSRFAAKSFMGVRVIDPRNPQSGVEQELVRKIHEMAHKAGLPAMPEVGIYNSPEVNAFATGPSKSRSLVAVSTGLLERMDSRAVEGVLGHEVAHIANGDMVTMTLIQGVVNTFVMFIARVVASMITQAMQGDRDREGGGVFAPNPFVYMMVVFALEMLLLPLGAIVVNYFSRTREFRADKGGARLAGVDKMIHGLESLRQTTELVDTRQQSMATLKISGKVGGVARLFMTHPPLEERIKALKAASIG